MSAPQTFVSPNASGIHRSEDENHAPAVTVSYLGNTLSRPLGSSLSTNTQFRRYASTVQTTAKLAGNTDSATRRIIYEIGRRHANVSAALAVHSYETILMDAAFDTSAVLLTDFSGLARKYSNFSGSFVRSDLAGMVERIAKTLACVSLYPNVTTTNMRGTYAANITALNTRGSPVSATETTVFIPRLVDTVLSPDVFSVLVHAATGEGASVVTDVVNLDNTTNAPIVLDVSGPALAKACVDALRVLGSNYAAADAGDIFSYALTRGLHSVLSVVGHTDEGGITRSLLRRSGFSSPYGGVHYGIGAYVGLPALSSTSPESIAGYTDAILLKTAALVAHCDPGAKFNSMWFPTTLSAGPRMNEQVPGDHEAVTDPSAATPPAMTGAGTPSPTPATKKGKTPAAPSASVPSGPVSDPDATEPLPAAAIIAANKMALIQVFSPFADNYVRALTKLFGFNVVSGIAARHFSECPSLLPRDERHLAYASFNPFFWIEPTSIIPHDFTGFAAESEGFASYATVGLPRTLPGFEAISPFGTGSTAFSYHVVKMRGPRASPFMAHWNANRANGLGNIMVKQLDPNAVIHPGPDTTAPLIRQRVEENHPLSQFLWTRGQSPFAAPGECLNLTAAWGIMVNHIVWSDDGDFTVNHVPAQHEFADTHVTFHVSAPVGIPTGATNTSTSDCRRARTKATRELAASILRSRVFGTPDAVEMPTLTSAPPLPGSAPMTHTTPYPQASTGPDPVVVDSTAGVVGGNGSPAPTAPAPIIMTHSAHKAPAAQRSVGTSYGAGSTSTTAPPLPQAASTHAANASTATPAPPTGTTGAVVDPASAPQTSVDAGAAH